MDIVLNLVVTCITFLVMEIVSWTTHKYVMHGFLWNLHEDHHDHKHTHLLEKNDLFFIIFATPSILLFYLGATYTTLYHPLFIGLGIMMYGFAYFVVHDIVIHQRFKLFTRSTFFYIVAIRKAHKIHHKNQLKHDNQCFGMLFVPVNFFRDALNTPKLKHK